MHFDKAMSGSLGRTRISLVLTALLPWTVTLFAQEDRQDPATAEAEDEASERLRTWERIEVRERADNLIGIADSATIGSTGIRALEARPLLRIGEIAETAPGLIATQHSGGGKANQYFVRGFNLDHGTDLSLSVAGVPVNMPSHGHGQGYADLNFLIPELIERVRFRKGTYFADSGDFSAAGALEIDLVRTLPRGILEFGVGNYDLGRFLLADSTRAFAGDLMAAVSAAHYDGPWVRPDDFQKFNGLVRFSRGDAERGFSVTAMGYDGEWLATDQVPERAVEGGLIERYGLIDPGPRGQSSRYSLSGELHAGSATSLTHVNAYLLSYDLELFSNFTYFLDDPEAGDQFLQLDERWVTGFDVSRRWLTEWGGRRVEPGAGLQVRYDDIDNGLFGTADLAIESTVRQDAIRQWSGGLWSDATISLARKVRTNLGLRLDGYAAEVDSSLPVNSGSASGLLLSPKLSLVLGPWRSSEVYLNLGRGFHSNDARGATIRVDPTTGEPVERVQPLVQATGADVGVRSLTLPGLQTTLTLFWLELDSELVFVGDGGFTEASRPSRRWGVEWTNHYTATHWLDLELDAAYSDAKFTDFDLAGSLIPGALEVVVSSGLAVHDLGGWFGGLRLRYFGDYPLVEDNSVRAGASALLNARIGYELPRGLQVTLEGFNLLGREDNDIEYYYLSRLPGEPLEGIEDVHFHPVERPSVRLSMRYRWGKDL